MDCDEQYRSNSGSISISSPNYPNNYPDNARCRYLIILRDPALRIILNFQRFSLEGSSSCAYDSVKMYDGNSVSAPQLGRREGYCGKRYPRVSLTSTGNSILIIFTSDRCATSSGFYLTYRGKPIVHASFLFVSLASVFTWVLPYIQGI